jgi:hypothetical protein
MNSLLPNFHTEKCWPKIVALPIRVPPVLRATARSQLPGPDCPASWTIQPVPSGSLNDRNEL